MARPSLKETRSAEILDAFMRCVARYGLDGSTLERISTEAGVGRPLLRHYLGNRDQIVDQLLTHVSNRFEAKTDDVFQALPAENRLEALIDSLFDHRDHSAEDAAVFQALVAASERHNTIQKPLLNFVTDFETRIAKEILRAKPHVNVKKSKVIAAGLTAIYFNTAAIMPLDPTRVWRGYQKQAAQILLQST